MKKRSIVSILFVVSFVISSCLAVGTAKAQIPTSTTNPLLSSLLMGGYGHMMGGYGHMMNPYSLYGLLGNTGTTGTTAPATSGLGYPYSLMGGMMGGMMGGYGRFNPYLYGGLSGSLGTTGTIPTTVTTAPTTNALGYPYSLMGGMMGGMMGGYGRFNPYLYGGLSGSLGTTGTVGTVPTTVTTAPATSALGLGYPYSLMGGMMGGMMGGYGHFNPYLSSGLGNSSLLGATPTSTLSSLSNPYGLGYGYGCGCMMGGCGCLSPYLYGGLFGSAAPTVAPLPPAATVVAPAPVATAIIPTVVAPVATAIAL